MARVESMIRHLEAKQIGDWMQSIEEQARTIINFMEEIHNTVQKLSFKKNSIPAWPVK